MHTNTKKTYQFRIDFSRMKTVGICISALMVFISPVYCEVEVTIHFEAGPGEETVLCSPPSTPFQQQQQQQTTWECVSQFIPQYDPIDYICSGENSIDSNRMEEHCVLAEYDIHTWICPTQDLLDYVRQRCKPSDNRIYQAIAGEPLSVSSGASGSVLLSAQFSDSCPQQQICLNQRLNKCCGLKKIGRQWKCPKLC